MSLWSNDGQLDEAAKVGLWVVVRKVGHNGGPDVPIDPVTLEEALRAFVGASDEDDGPTCWVSEDGAYWHAEVRWEGGLGWDPVGFPSPEALGRDLEAFAAWAQRVADWVRSKPVTGLPRTVVKVTAQYGKIWRIPLAGGSVENC